jgi:hypothetical protein
VRARIKITGHKTDKPRVGIITGRKQDVVFKDGLHTFVNVRLNGISRKALVQQLREMADDIENRAW